MSLGLSDPSRLRLVLAVSVAVNLLVIGWAVGSRLVAPPPPNRHPLATRFEERLSPEGMARIAPRLQALLSEVSNGMRAFEDGRDRLRLVVGRENFDDEAIRVELAALTAARNSQEDRVRETLVGVLRDLGAADRRAFVEALFPPPPPEARRPPPP
jgi:hypothetical protein